MKTKFSVLALAGTLGGFLLLASGCASPKTQPPAPQSHAPGASRNPAVAGDLADEVGGEPSTSPGARGTPESLARYAAGVSYEWNDESEKAVREFDLSALADPSNEKLIIRVAENYLKGKHPSKAVAVLNKSAERPDASAELLGWLSRAELQAGKTNQALAASHRAIRQYPAAFDGYESQMEILFRNHQGTAALHTLNQAAKSVTPEPAGLLAVAGLYSVYLKAQPKDLAAKTNALTVLDRVAAMKFSSMRLWQTLAEMYAQLSEPKKAAGIYLKLLAQVAESSPLRETLHEKLAGLYFQAEDKTNAMKQLRAIVRDGPTRYPRAWFFLGELSFEDEKWADAADDYENALQWDPAIEEAYYKLALADIALHRSEHAFHVLDLARARFPKTFLGEFYTGVAYLHVKNYPESVRHFDAAEIIAKATDSTSLDYRFYYQFGSACERNQDFQRADQNLQKCINLSPDFGEALNYLGYMLADRGEQLPRARTLIEKAVHLEPKNGAYLDSLGWVLFKQHQPQQALPWLLKSLQLSSEPDATVLDHVGEVYMALHEPAKALESWKKSLSIESNPDVKKKIDSVSGGV